MLDPYFYRCPPELELNLQAPGMRFEITGYSQEDDFTLLGWRFGDGDEYISGEILYQGREVLICGGGRLNLPGDNNPDLEAPNPWDRVIAQDLMLSSVITQSLRDNFIFFPFF
jgi:hypothetical protein